MPSSLFVLSFALGSSLSLAVENWRNVRLAIACVRTQRNPWDAFAGCRLVCLIAVVHQVRYLDIGSTVICQG